MSKETVTLDGVVQLLRDMLSLDANALQQLCDTRVSCNRALADHPTIQTVEDGAGRTTVGLLGVLNGLFGVDEAGSGLLFISFEPNGKISGVGRALHRKRKEQ